MVEAPLSVFLLTIVWLPLASPTSRSGILVIASLMPMQFALQLVHTLFVYSELILGFFALRVLARYQISRFHYKQFDENKQDEYEKKQLKSFNDDFNWLETLNNRNKGFNMKTFANLKVKIFLFHFELFFNINLFF